MNGFVFLVLGIFLSMLIIPVAMRMAPFVGMVDQPDPRKVHAKPVPRIGGIGISIGALLPLTIFLPQEPLLQSFLLGAFILFVFGAWDDAKQISHWIKFAGQFAAVGLVVYYGDLWVERFPFLGGQTLPPEIGKPFTLFAMVGVINAINHSDGLDGLAGGESLLSLIVMGFLAFVVNDAFGVALCCAVAGGILGFLRFNTHPARIFMGDAGSQFIGFSIGYLAVYLTQLAHPALSPALPLLLVGLPIADINAVFYLRITGGMNWFKATRNHIHHRLLDLGFEHYETVIIIYSIQALMVGTAVVLRYESDVVVALGFFSIVSGLFVLLTWAERKKISFSTNPEQRAISRFIKNPSPRTTMSAGAESAAVWAFYVLIIVGALAAAEVPQIVALISAGLILACVISLLAPHFPNDSILFRFSTYALALLTVYLGIHGASANIWLSAIVGTEAYMLLGLFLALAIRLSSEDVFKTTATDYLILFGLITIAVFGRELFEARHISLLIVHSTIMVYASEFACRARATRISTLHYVVIIGLSIIVIRGFIWPRAVSAAF